MKVRLTQAYFDGVRLWQAGEEIEDDVVPPSAVVIEPEPEPEPPAPPPAP